MPGTGLEDVYSRFQVGGIHLQDMAAGLRAVCDGFPDHPALDIEQAYRYLLLHILLIFYGDAVSERIRIAFEGLAAGRQGFRQSQRAQAAVESEVLGIDAGVFQFVNVLAIVAPGHHPLPL